VEHPYDFHIVISDAEKDCIGAHERRPEAWYQLFATPSSKLSLGDPSGRPIYFAQQIVRDFGGFSASVVAPDLT
jgi:hypothetical protein